MRPHVIVAGLALLAASIVAPAIGLAQSVPSSSDIIKSLTPSGASGATRGLRIAPPAPGQPPSQAHVAAAASAAAPSINLSVLFATGSTELTPQAVAVLNSLGKALSDETLAHYRFRIEGHTDTVGTREYNLDLSNRRAAAVVDYLASNFHIDRSRVEAIGMGEDQLLVPTPDQTPEPRNRRVHVVNIGS
ncbi:MAG TPA: OmpA family protein [Acetobacteraceae bacterium]|jgi:outer membrane protein OmpA-like peptidoglycan-associated protein|nr:OmpA family protein [Acetobacteraceae bacterium]